MLRDKLLIKIQEEDTKNMKKNLTKDEEIEKLQKVVKLYNQTLLGTYYINQNKELEYIREQKKAVNKTKETIDKYLELSRLTMALKRKIDNDKNINDQIKETINKQFESEQIAKTIEEQLKSFKDMQISQTTQDKTDTTADIYENLDKYFEDYLKYRENHNKVSASSLRSYQGSLNYLKYFITKDTELTFKFFKDFQSKLQLLPVNFTKYKKYYTLNFDDLMKLKEKENYTTLNKKTVNKHINFCKMFFDFLVYEEIITDSPLKNIKRLEEETLTNKEEYTESELISIFNSNMDIEYKNLCKFALYTGLRIGEVLSIKKVDVKDGLIHIQMADTNNKKHERIIPIHKNLLNVISYQNKHNSGIYLFFDGNSGNEVGRVGKLVNRRLREIVNNQDKSYHSFRKNFSQEIELSTNAEESIKKYLMGHSQSKNITHMIYNRGKVNLNKLQNCINQITFKY